MKRKSVSGQTALVTGAARGIGRCLAELLLSKGARVVLADIDASVERVAETLGGEAVILDVTDPEAWQRAVAAVGAIDILINNAGIMPIGAFLDHDTTVDVRQIDINVHGVIHGMRAVLPGMLERKRGHIVNISSVAGRIGTPHIAVYSGAKHAVVGLTEAVRAEMGVDCPVDFTFACPSLVDTELISGTGRPRWPPPLQPQEVAAAIVDAVERRRVELYIPRMSRLSVILPALLPRRLYERVGRMFSVHTMFEDVDQEGRAAYRRRIFGK